jgi:hypothetical protein
MQAQRLGDPQLLVGNISGHESARPSAPGQVNQIWAGSVTDIIGGGIQKRLPA